MFQFELPLCGVNVVSKVVNKNKFVRFSKTSVQQVRYSEN